MGQQEEWRDVKGYEGIYQVSNQGRVRSLDRRDKTGHFWKGAMKAINLDKDGYPTVGLCLDNHMKIGKVHRLVAEAFIPNPEGKPHVQHLDDIKTHNTPDNLAWATCKENLNNNNLTERRMPFILAASKRSGELSAQPVVGINIETEEVIRFCSTKEAGRKGGFNPSTVAACCRGSIFSHYGFAWGYGHELALEHLELAKLRGRSKARSA